MPCQDWDYPATLPTVTVSQYEKIKKDLDNVTRMLCGLVEQVNDAKEQGLHSDHLNLAEVKGLVEWYARHEQLDRENTLQMKQKELAALKDRAKKIQKLGGDPSRQLQEKLDSVESEVKDLAEKLGRRRK